MRPFFVREARGGRGGAAGPPDGPQRRTTEHCGRDRRSALSGRRRGGEKPRRGVFGKFLSKAAE